MNSFFFTVLYGGTYNGFISTIVLPIDTIKLLLQNENALLNSGIISSPYNGIIDCYKRTIHANGILFLWNGILINIIRAIPLSVITFSALEYLNSKLGRKDKNKHGYFNWLFFNTFNVSCASVISNIFLNPLDYIRTRLGTNLNNSNGEKQFTGNLDVFVQTVASEGILGLYRGFFMFSMGTIIYRGSYFIIHDILHQITPEKYRDNSYIKFMINTTTLIIANSLSYPFYTIRRRMMMSNCSNMVFTSGYSCMKYIITNEGYLSLYKGIYANIYRLLGVMIVMQSYDYFKRKTYRMISTK